MNSNSAENYASAMHETMGAVAVNSDESASEMKPLRRSAANSAEHYASEMNATMCALYSESDEYIRVLQPTAALVLAHS